MSSSIGEIEARLNDILNTRIEDICGMVDQARVCLDAMHDQFSSAAQGSNGEAVTSVHEQLLRMQERLGYVAAELLAAKERGRVLLSDWQLNGSGAGVADHSVKLNQPEVTTRKRLPYDRVKPEGFFRRVLDRNIGEANGFFVRAFGVGNGPLQAAVDTAEEKGRVDLLDVGGGTGHTARTWGEAVRRYVASPEDVKVTCLNPHDYSDESRSARTRQGVRNGEITYLEGRVESMRQVPGESADVVMASWVVYHSKRPTQAIREMLRVLKPGGKAFLSVKGDHEISDSPIFNLLCQLEDRGHEVKTRVKVIGAPNGQPGDPWLTTFICIGKPLKD